jgi:hypothetical protein
LRSFKFVTINLPGIRYKKIKRQGNVEQILPSPAGFKIVFVKGNGNIIHRSNKQNFPYSGFIPYKSRGLKVTWCPSRNEIFCSRSRHAKTLTAGIRDELLILTVGFLIKIGFFLSFTIKN